MRNLVLVTVLLLQALLSVGAVSATILPSEREALEQIYDVLQGANWSNNSGWKQTGLDPCAFPGAWSGVQCDETGTHVAALHLLGNRLAGDFGALTRFRNLTQLRQLELGNHLGIPATEWNRLSGSLPPGFETLTQLYYIDLRFNAVRDQLDRFATLGQLQHLALEENQFYGPLPASLGGLAELTVLTLNGNQLTGAIPSALGGLAKLTKLWLYDNTLEGTIPPELGDLAQLTELRLGGNALSGAIPPSLGRLRSLERLELGLAFLDGELPPDLADLGQLKALSLGTNRLSGSLARVDWSRLTHLEEIYLDTNLFSGALPESLAALPDLRILRLRANGLQGDVPDAYLRFLGRAGELDLRWNALDPPASVTQLLDLRSSGEFSATQTIAPRSIAAVRSQPTSIFVSWTSIPFVAGGGGYRIEVVSDPGTSTAPLRTVIVSGKERTSTLVGGLPEGPPLFVRLSTLTDAHPGNPAPVESIVSGAVPVDPAAGPGVARFERDRYVVREGDVLNLKVLRIDGSAGSLVAKVTARQGSANADDFSPPRPPTLTWLVGETAAKAVTLATVGDARQEPTETLEIVLTAGANASQATAVEIGDRVVTGTAGDPVIATNSQGLSFVAWMQPQANSALRDIVGRFLDSSGRAIGGPVEVAVNGTLDEHDPEVVALEDDSFVVAWIQNRENDPDKRMGRCRPTAGEAKCARTVRTTPWFGVTGLALAADGGSFWLGWTTPAGFFAKKDDDSGNATSDAVRVAAPPAGSSQAFVEPRLVRLRTDLLVAVWTSIVKAEEAAELGGEVQAQAFSAGGQGVGPLRRFGGSSASSQRRPRVVRTSDTAAFVAWEETGKIATAGAPRIAWSEIPIDEDRELIVQRLIPSGRAIGQLEVLRHPDSCQIVWLSTTATGELFERRVVPGCSLNAGSSSRPDLVVDALEGRRESFAVTSTPRGLLFVEEFVASRGVRWLKAARPPNL